MFNFPFLGPLQLVFFANGFLLTPVLITQVANRQGFANGTVPPVGKVSTSETSQEGVSFHLGRKEIVVEFIYKVVEKSYRL